MYFSSFNSGFDSCCDAGVNPNDLKTQHERGKTLWAEVCILINRVHTSATREQLCNTTAAKWAERVHSGSGSCREKNDGPEQSDQSFFLSFIVCFIMCVCVLRNHHFLNYLPVLEVDDVGPLQAGLQEVAQLHVLWCRSRFWAAVLNPCW